MSEEDFKRCKAIVKELKKPKYEGITWPFKAPVDAAALGATDYYDIIKQPMDMSTYEQKLHNFEYKSENELIDDIRLMFKNCYTYNPPDHLIHNLGKEFEQVFERQWAKLQTRSLHKKSSSTLKRRHTEKSDQNDTDYVDKVEPEVKKQKSNSDQNRSTILRLKIPTKPKEDEPIKPKPVVKTPSLALSSTPTNAPKLAISTRPDSPVKEKKPQPSVLHNNDKWLELAKKSPPPPPVTTIKKPKVAITPPRPAPKPKEPVTPAAATFDINDIYNKIHNEKKLNEQKKREEQERWEKSERLRLEREKVISEERMKKQREFIQQQQAQRQKDIQQRLSKLNAHTIDISQQKLTFAKFEATQLARDQDWRDIYTWQRETIDYRHFPVPGFVKRAPINVSDLRKQLLTKCLRLKKVEDDDEGSDMDID